MAGFYGDVARKAGSDNESQISDVDPAEMAKMLEGLDDMDSDLFGSSLKNRKGKSLASPTARAKSALKSPAVDDGERQGKSHVTFGISDKNKRSTPRKSQTFDDFDIDDPLADLLSDEDSELKKKTKRASPARSKLSTDAQDQHTVNSNKESKSRSKTVADLFGFDDDEKDKEGVGNPSLSAPAKPIKENPSPLKSKFLTNDLEPSNVKTTPLRTTKKSEDVIDRKVTNPSPRPRSEGVKFDDGDDILDSMGFGGDRNRGSRRGLGTEKPSQSRPKSVLDELLGKHPPPKKEEEFNISHLEVKKSASKPELREDSGVSFGDYSPTVTAGREGRRLSSRRNTTALGDPVGLFSSPTTPQRHSFQEGMGENYGYEASPVKGRPTLAEIFGEEMNSLSPRRRSPASNQGTEPVPRSRHAAKQSPARSNPLTPQKIIADDDDLPEWLGGSGGRKKQTTSEVLTQHPTPVEQQPPPPPPPQDHPQREQAPVVQSSTVVGELFLNSQLEQQVVLALQRQEAALLAASGLKVHEAQLSEVQRRQQLLLEQQETQLRKLVERQVERQRQLEETLRVQQERISSHMQALLSEPPGMVILEAPKVTPPPVQTLQTPTVTPAPVPASVSEPVPEPVQTSAPAPQRVSVAIETDPVNNEELIETQVALQKCELQKTYLEAKLENLEMKHKEEVQLLEECYKRQMSILEEAIVNQEARLRAENQRLEADYKDRILKMQELHAQLVEEHGQQLAALQQERLADLQKLREQQQAMLEHVRQAQKAETSAIKDASEHVTSLQSTVEILSRSAGGLGELQGKLEEQQRLQSSAREAAIKAKEEDLRALQESLEKQQEAVEKENRRLKGLEVTLSSHRHELEEKLQSQQRVTEKLEVEQQRLESQRQQLESMKLAMLEEQKAWRQQFSEERMSLAAEKSRLETMARLQNGSSKQDEVAQLKAEAETQLAVAREAAERAQLERTSLKEQQRRLDSERRRLTEMEHDLTVRAREVEGLAQIAKTTRNDSVEALAEASRMERTTSERALELQQQLKDLQEREQRLAQEKVNLSQERLSLRKSREPKLCSSCKGLLVRQPSSPDHSRAASITFSDKFVDPKLVIMKLAAEREREALESNLSVLHSISK